MRELYDFDVLNEKTASLSTIQDDLSSSKDAFVAAVATAQGGWSGEGADALSAAADTIGNMLAWTASCVDGLRENMDAANTNMSETDAANNI